MSCRNVTLGMTSLTLQREMAVVQSGIPTRVPCPTFSAPRATRVASARCWLAGGRTSSCLQTSLRQPVEPSTVEQRGGTYCRKECVLPSRLSCISNHRRDDAQCVLPPMPRLFPTTPWKYILIPGMARVVGSRSGSFRTSRAAPPLAASGTLGEQPSRAQYCTHDGTPYWTGGCSGAFACRRKSDFSGLAEISVPNRFICLFVRCGQKLYMWCA